MDYGGYPRTAGYGAIRWWVRNDDPVIATLSEPFYSRYWWPCKDALDDKATMQMHVTEPSSLVALSNGYELGSEALAGGRTKYFWHETYPMVPYLASLAIASYQRYELQYEFDSGGFPGTMPVSCYFYPDHWDFGAGEPLPAHKAGCDELPTMLETFSGLFGQYPWITEKYGVVETGGSGGLRASMEHQTLSSMWKIDHYSNIMAHELAHQWWGDEVTCQTWHDILIPIDGPPIDVEFDEEGGISNRNWVLSNSRSRVATPLEPPPVLLEALVIFDDDIFANGKKLDGETDSEAWWDEVSLPSGDGRPAGSSVLSFAVSPARHLAHHRFLDRPHADRPDPAGWRRAACGGSSAGRRLRPARR